MVQEQGISRAVIYLGTTYTLGILGAFAGTVVGAGVS